MPSLIQDDDRQTVKRVVPKASNKILAVAIAKLYIAYPDRQRWTYTGLQGAAVLANDTVGNTFWIKLVDISVRSSSPWIVPIVAYTHPSPQTVVSFGIKKYTTPFHTIKTGFSSIRSSWKSAWLGYHSWTTRKPRSSSRRWTNARVRLTETQKPGHSEVRPDSR